MRSDIPPVLRSAPARSVSGSMSKKSVRSSFVSSVINRPRD